MKTYIQSTGLILLLLFSCLTLKAGNSLLFHPDSVPAPIQALEEYYQKPQEYIKHWNILKARADSMNSARDEFFLYKDRNYFHYIGGEVDSLRKYTAIVKDLCLKYKDVHGFYYNWLLLSEGYNNVGNGKAGTFENEQMYNYARENKSETGMAYNQFAIASGYLAARDNQKAEPYLVRAMRKFYQMKRWDIYAVLASNEIILLSAANRETESQKVFQQLDSLANLALAGKLHGFPPRNIAMTKYLVFNKCVNSGDIKTFKKYLSELEEVYRKYPSIPRFYLFDGKQTYAYLMKDYIMQAAYIDSCANYYKSRNSKENMRRMYLNGANALAMANKYDEAYHKLISVIELGDTLSWEKTQKQLNYLSTKYDVNKLKLEKQELSLKARNMQLLLTIGIGIILLFILFFRMTVYRRQLKLNAKIHQQDLQLIAANEKIQKANEMKNVFIQNMNHEIRTPLNTIVGFADCLATPNTFSSDEIKEISNTIKNNSDHLLRLISDMLSIASLDSDSEEPMKSSFSVNECCSHVIDEVKEFANANVHLHATLKEEDFTMVSDRKMIHQILFNLLHNAVKFTPEGEIELSYEITPDKKEIRFLVRDTGIGIPQKEQKKVFERFYKVNSFTQGSGLGLSLCQILVQRLQGSLYLDNEYKEGSLFVFIHPLS